MKKTLLNRRVVGCCLASGLALAISMLSGCRPPVVDVVQPEGESSTAAAPIQVADSDWPGWRGLNGDGQAVGPAPPMEWSESSNVRWKTSVPGNGHASPIVVGDQVFVATADESGNRQLIVAFDRGSGKLAWRTETYQGSFMRKHGKNSHASATPVSDGRRVYSAFIADNGLQVAAVGHDGELAWVREAGPFKSKHGYGSSPVLFENLVIVAGDNGGGGFLAALHRDSGDVVWRQRRSSTASFGTPLLAEQEGKWQLLHSGHRSLISYDPATGQELWRADGPATTTANTPVHVPGLVVVSGGFPQRSIMGVRTDGTGEVLWSHAYKCYVPSPLIFDKHVLLVQDNGVARFFELETGDQKWQLRLSGNFSASPVRIGAFVLLPNEAGTTFVLRPTESECDVVARNQLPGDGLASVAVSDGQLFVRTSDSLYCIDEPTTAEPKPAPQADAS